MVLMAMPVRRMAKSIASSGVMRKNSTMQFAAPSPSQTTEGSVCANSLCRKNSPMDSVKKMSSAL